MVRRGQARHGEVWSGRARWGNGGVRHGVGRLAATGVRGPGAYAR